MPSNYNHSSQYGYGTSTQTQTNWARSPTSFGEMVISHEQQLSPQQMRDNARYNRSGGMWENARKLGERSQFGRLASGHYSSGPKFQGAIWGLGGALLRNAGRLSDAVRVVSFVINYTETIINKPASYTEVLECLPVAPVHVSGLAAPTFCGAAGEFVVQDSTIDTQPNARRVGVWGAKLRDYITPGFGVYPLKKVFTKPSGYTPDTITISTDTFEFVRVIPGSWIFPAPQVGPMSWAPDFSRPIQEFATHNDTTTYHGSSAPWTSTGAGTSTTVGTETVPLPGTQVITPGTTPPLVTNPEVPPSRPPGKRTKEVKFAGSKVALRLLRLALATTEAIDAIEAISAAIPEKYSKECKAAAKRRYWHNRKTTPFNKGRTNWQMTPPEHLQCIYNNLDHLNMNHVMYNLVKNQIEDMWAGWQYGLLDKGIRSGRGRGGGNTTRSPFKHSPLELPEWDDPFWSEVQQYLETKGLQ